MSSFNMKMRRTRRHNEDGSIIYNTMNSTGLEYKYKNRNARVDSISSKVGTSGNKCACTISGCGKQCCFNYFLISDISQNVWENASAFNKGGNIIPGTKVYSDSNQLLGTIEDYFFPYSNPCIPLGDCDCSGSFPISVRIVIRSSKDSCVLNLPVDISLKFKTSSGTEFKIGKNTSNSSVKIVKENYEILGSSRKGKPYRAPIAGYRKNLECCDPATECTEYCLIEFKGDPQYPNVLSVGKNLYLIDGTFYGTIFSVEANKFTVKFLLGECHSKLKDYLKYTNNYSGKFLNADGTDFITLTIKPLITQKLKECKTVTNDVYKDPYVRSCDVSGVCYDKRIRSGMQPKKQLTCKNDCDKKCEKKYSFSYSQYNKNRVMNTYERGLEKNRQWDPVNKEFIKCETEFFKSSGDACLATYKNCVINKNKLALSLPTTAITTWKPNNKIFKKQGAVSAGNRLERLKLDTIKSANSKCGKDNRCITKDCEKIPNGPYFAGKPRFTGWIYNAKHREKVWPNRNISYIKNRPVPLGIPQLTNKCRSTRYKFGMVNWKPQSSGTRGVYQRGFPNQRSTAKNLRVPGYRDVCDKKCDQICKDQTKRYLGNIKCKN